MKPKQGDLDILARTLYGESEPYNYADANAIASVIMNRVDFRLWPNTIREVCLQPWQFSCWNEHDPNRQRILAVTKADPWFNECLMIAEQVASGVLGDMTMQSTHYYATFIKKPKWAKGKSPVYEVEHKNGNKHLFFNNIDTKPPKTAQEALEQKRPLTQSRTIQGAGMASTGVGLAAVTEIVGDLQNQIEPLIPYAETLKIIFLFLALIGIGVTVWARISDRKKGFR